MGAIKRTKSDAVNIVGLLVLCQQYRVGLKCPIGETLATNCKAREKCLGKILRDGQGKIKESP